MGETEGDDLLELWERNVCPHCGSNIPEGTRVGSGRRGDGGFCSLDCFAKYHALNLLDRARRIETLIKRHRES